MRKPLASRWYTEMTPTRILLVHGFTGSHFDLVPLSNALSTRGFNTEVLTLPGHDSKVEDLLSVKSQDWLDAGQKALNEGPQIPTIVVALSMGSFVATWLAANPQNQIKGLVFLAPAFVLRPFGRLGVALSKLGIYKLAPYLHKTNGPDIRDPQARRESKAYNSIPLKSLIEFEALRKQATALLGQVKCPVFVGSGAHDHTVDNEATKKVLSKLGASRVEWHRYANTAHIVPLDFDREQVEADVASFIQSIL